MLQVLHSQPGNLFMNDFFVVVANTRDIRDLENAQIPVSIKLFPIRLCL